MPSGWCVRGSKQRKGALRGVCWNLAGKKTEIKSDGPVPGSAIRVA